MNLFGNLIGTVLRQVAKRNKDNDAVKTADPVVFTDLEKKLETVNESAAPSRADALRDYFEKIREAQAENEANPNVETADKSVYEDILEQLEQLKPQVEHENRVPDIEMPQVQVNQVPGVTQAWNSSGGTLEGRMAPDMGAQKATLRIPNGGVFNVLEYSQNSVNLDGKQSRFALVEVGGQKAWVLESYLNFN
jgi:hypothetical protein